MLNDDLKELFRFDRSYDLFDYTEQKDHYVVSVRYMHSSIKYNLEDPVFRYDDIVSLTDKIKIYSNRNKMFNFTFCYFNKGKIKHSLFSKLKLYIIEKISLDHTDFSLEIYINKKRFYAYKLKKDY